MTEECRHQITSNDYADFIVEYNSNYDTFNRFQTDCYNIINYKYGVAYIPMNRITRNVLQEFGYPSFPTCYGLLDTASLAASGVTRIQSIPDLSLRGKDVLIGIVDTGIEYTNNAFKNADNTTRIESIWDQTIQSENYPGGFFYGTEYSREQINEALNSENPYDIVPSRDEKGHGTFLAGIAAGSPDIINRFSGVVPEAEYVVVKLKEAKSFAKDFFFIPTDVVCYQKNDIMFGVKYLTDVAKRVGKPIVICIGLGSNQCGHDGREFLSEFLSDSAYEIGTGIVIAAGNERNRKHHYYGIVDNAAGFDKVEVNVGENDSGFTMELWGSAPNTYSFDILSPTGEYIPRIPAIVNESRDIKLLFEDTTIYVDYNLVESQTGDQLILIRFQNPTPGIWTFNVYARGDLTLDYHIWLPIHNFIGENTYFVKPNPDTTVTSPGNALTPMTVTGYNNVSGEIYQFASRGYTRTNVVKPDITAPAVNLIGPTLDNGFGTESGTSLAAAHTAGIVAMLFEWGIVRGNYYTMNSVEAKKFLIRGAKRDSRNRYPNKEWGYGIIDIYNSFESLRRD